MHILDIPKTLSKNTVSDKRCCASLRGVSWFHSPAASYNTVQVKSTGGMFKFSHRAGRVRPAHTANMHFFSEDLINRMFLDFKSTKYIILIICFKNFNNNAIKSICEENG